MKDGTLSSDRRDSIVTVGTGVKVVTVVTV